MILLFLEKIFMGLIVSNGSRENIERSITHNFLGTLAYPPETSVLNAMTSNPFINNTAIINASGGVPMCWGFQNPGRPHWTSLFRQLQVGDYFLIFENIYKDNGVRIKIPAPRVFSGKVVYKEPNLAFGDALWRNPNQWYFIYFLIDLKLQTNDKVFFCSHLGLPPGEFKQQRFDIIPQAIANLL